MIKFLHVLFAIGLLTMTGYCFANLNTVTRLKRLNQLLLILSPFAMITGVLLVHPKQYTFHTHWIEAAILFLSVFSISIFCLLIFHRKVQSTWILRIIYTVLFMILLIITFDAVTKNSYFWIGSLI